MARPKKEANEVQCYDLRAKVTRQVWEAVKKEARRRHCDASQIVRDAVIEKLELEAPA